MRQTRLMRRVRAALVLGCLGSAGPAHALACADPITYLYVCCPKPCQINDAQGVIQNTLKDAMETMKLTSMVSQMTAWKDQLSMFGQTLNMINGLINTLFGLKHAAISGFGNPTLVPYGMSGNPLNIGQMAGQAANIFFRPGSSQADEMRSTTSRQGMISAGYLESVASGVNGRTMLDKSAEEYRDLLKVVNNAAESDTGGSRDENDVNVHTDLAAMNQGRIAMLRAAQNQVSVANVWLSTESYHDMGRMGVDRNTDANSWSGGLSTGEIQRITPALKRLAEDASDVGARADLLAEIGGSLLRGLSGASPREGVVRLAQATTPNGGLTPKSAYDTGSAAFATMAEDAKAGRGFIDPAVTADVASRDAFTAYDNLMERAVQVHNAATAYVSMMGTIRLNQETIALYDITTAAAAEQRRRVIEGLSMFYASADDAFNRMAVEAVGTDALGGNDPYKYGDSVAQQAAAKNALAILTKRVLAQPTAYGGTVCRNVWTSWRIRNGWDGKWVASFTRLPSAWTPVLQAIYANPQQQTCEVLLSQWLNAPAAQIYDATTDTSGFALTSADIDQTNAVKKTISDAALKEFLSDGSQMQPDPNFMFWINLTKRAVWMKDYAAHANDVITNTRAGIANLQTNTNDPATTEVLQVKAVQDLALGPVDLTSESSVRGQMSAYLSTAESYRKKVDPKTFDNEAVSIREAQLKAAVLVMKGDSGFQQWATTAPAMADVACGTQQCWGVADQTWAQPATVMGASVGPKNPSPDLPVAQAEALATQPTSDRAMSYCDTLSVNTAGKSFVSCPVQAQEGFIPTVLSPAPFTTGIGIQR